MPSPSRKNVADWVAQMWTERTASARVSTAASELRPDVSQGTWSHDIPITAEQRQSRAGVPAYTNGWFQVAWSDELRPGQVKRLHYFGRELVLFRSKDGQAHVLDAYCPHMGAHLAEGGRVVGDTIQCPFHGWSFRGDGSCAMIPYSQSPPPIKARTRSWPVHERHGQVFVYHHAKGQLPDREPDSLPELDDGKWLAPAKHTLRVRVHPRDFLENSVDRAHFRFAHGMELPKTEWERRGSELHVIQRMDYRWLGQINVDATLDFRICEPGLTALRFRFLTDVLIIGCMIPVDEELIEHRLSVFVRKRWVPPISEILRRYVLFKSAEPYSQDVPLWAHKIMRDPMVLCDGDGPIMQLRRWYGEFV